MGVPETSVGAGDPGASEEWDTSIDFVTTKWQRFLLRVAARRIERTGVTAGIAAGAQQDGSPGGDDDLDDVLF